MDNHIDKEENIDFKSVLIIIDMVKGFTDIGALKSQYIKNIAPDIRKQCDKFKNIIAINDKHEKGDYEFNFYPEHCLAGTEEIEMCNELADVNFYSILYKNSTNGFFADGFFEVFNKFIEKSCDFIVVGCCTDICVLQFCLTFKGYLNSINSSSNIIVIKDLVDTYESENHNREYLNSLSFHLMDNAGIKLKNSII